MINRFKIPIIQQKNNQSDNSNTSKAENRESRLFKQSKKRRFCDIDLTDSSVNHYNDLSSESSAVMPLMESVSITEKMKLNDSKNTALDLLEKFLYLDEKLNDNDGFPHVMPFMRSIRLFIKIDLINSNATSNYCILKRTPFPEFISSSFKDCYEKEEKCFVLTGIYEELNLVYFTKDNMIYLWNFVTNEVITYSQITAIISALHITKPKSEFFSDEITHVMIVATNLNISILLIKENEIGSIELIKSDLLVDFDTNYIITCIASTNQRRVFLGSQNNFLYELDYKVIKV